MRRVHSIIPNSAGCVFLEFTTFTNSLTLYKFSPPKRQKNTTFAVSRLQVSTFGFILKILNNFPIF